MLPITSGGAVVNAGASAGILLALGVSRSIAINFSLGSALLIVSSAVVVTTAGVGAALVAAALARTRSRHA